MRQQPAAVTNCTRVSDDVATAGLLGEGAIGELKAAGLRYFNIPVTGLPSGAQVIQFSQVLGDRADLPVLVHCASGNRVGTMWALYRARSGVPAATAMDEGRHIGLRGDREAAIAAR